MEFRVGDRVLHSGIGSVGVVTELTPIHTMFVREPLVPGAVLLVESGPFHGQIVPFELSQLEIAVDAVNTPMDNAR
jgi:hypothetical protein